MKTMFVFFIHVFLFSLPLQAQEPLVFAIGDWEPYTSSRIESCRIMEQVVAEVFSSQGIQVEFEYFPWKRSYEYVKQGRYAGTFPWFRTKRREVAFYINDEVMLQEDSVFFIRKDSEFDWNDFEDLEKYKIGATIGYADTIVLEDKGIQVVYASFEDLNYRLVLESRIDAYPTAINVGYYQIDLLFDKEEADLLTHHPKPLAFRSYFMLFNRDYPGIEEISEQFDRGLRDLKASGRYAELLAQFENPIPAGEN